MANSALSTLNQLAENEVENAGRNLGRMIKARDDANEQLNLLNQYRSDYELRFQATQNRD